MFIYYYYIKIPLEKENYPYPTHDTTCSLQIERRKLSVFLLIFFSLKSNNIQILFSTLFSFSVVSFHQAFFFSSFNFLFHPNKTAYLKFKCH